MLKHIFKLTKENKLLQSMNNPATILFFEVVSRDSRLGTIPLKTVSLCSDTTFPAPLPVLENLLEAIKRLLLWPRNSRYGPILPYSVMEMRRVSFGLSRKPKSHPQ